ncbi:glutamine-hydrolyzing carbamoyl-phosphate synthase small subunit [Candidatus Liberibacter africanus]|uniref:Carbamoyl phosphate synthase small chain n=1 Tax=Candidatus Liberibacter africanus PTSAPSY TaxID=1277257 RepID=A0A0G3I2X6_LIBAF|nr:glutamine-hydrolyzing carbamoyl-phosphate synthase small subunit [Candidatus Liberibacter africanus]AKK20236.1 carbamoyl phosphate synthase small subunit [Candidatus Liberibacter africanus PTSAPSY]QTP64011.1 glutamine-hydrolyzing carbamoyl-phosphate synthase small subunit [Candidatus Liberibacter africanus]
MTVTIPWTIKKPTAVLVLQDGSVIEGMGCGATGSIQSEICFNTSFTGYQEILTDPSYLGQIVNFTFPHIGNVGVNEEDFESISEKNFKGAAGLIIKSEITDPSNYRSNMHFDAWLKSCGIIGLSGVDTRALTVWIRDNGVSNSVIAHHPDADFDLEALRERAKNWGGLKGSELAKHVTISQKRDWSENVWKWGKEACPLKSSDVKHHVVCIDYGIKRNILRILSSLNCRVTIMRADSSYEDIISLQPDGILLSNGPGDPVATSIYSTPIICKLVDSGIPIFGICLGHQLLGLALGAKTVKMYHGHHGVNHPVKNLMNGKVEIVSMNHGFAIDASTLPAGLEETHISLFDSSNCGLRFVDRPVFSVQYHPESSPGPQDSYYLFSSFLDFMCKKK